jgi:hypothetical protein
MSWGNKPTDGGHLIFTREEKDAFLAKEPQARKFIRPFMSGRDFVNGVERYCLWLVDAHPQEVRALPEVLKRIESVKASRLASKAPSTRAYASRPMLFRQIAQPTTNYLAIPEVSSERRAYIPIAFLDKDVICSNKIQFVPDATLYHFGILTSTMHMAWVRIVAGRLKSDFSYSNTLVYNNFPWPITNAKQTSAVESAAQSILDARAQFPSASLADLYDPLTMPAVLVKAHATLNRIVDRCYRDAPFHNERERVEHLFEMYDALTSPLLPTSHTKPNKRKATKKLKNQ